MYAYNTDMLINTLTVLENLGCEQAMSFKDTSETLALSISTTVPFRTVKRKLPLTTTDFAIYQCQFLPPRTTDFAVDDLVRASRMLMRLLAHLPIGGGMAT
ncbi:hypothetical protein U1Q18_005119 [Sarracenia purpurea var. burkii]